MATIVRRASLLLQLMYNFVRYSVLQQAGNWLQSRVQRKTKVIEFRPRQSDDEDENFLDIGTTEVDCHLGSSNKGKPRRRSNSYVCDERKRRGKGGRKQKKRRIQVTPSETRAVWEEPSTSESNGRNLPQESNPSVEVNGTRSKRESRNTKFTHKVNSHNNDDQILSQRSEPGCSTFAKHDDNAQLQEVEMGLSFPTSSRGGSSDTHKDNDKHLKVEAFIDTLTTINPGEDPLFLGGGEVSSSGDNTKGKKNGSFFLSSMVCFKGKRSRNKRRACPRSGKTENKNSNIVDHDADLWKVNSTQEGSNTTEDAADSKDVVPNTPDSVSTISENETNNNHAGRNNGQEIKSSKEDDKNQCGNRAFLQVLKRKKEKLSGNKDQERKSGESTRGWKVRFRRKQKRSQVEELAGCHSYCRGNKPVPDQDGKRARFQLFKRKKERLSGNNDHERKGRKNTRGWKLKLRRKQKLSQVEELAGYHSYCHGNKPVSDGPRDGPQEIPPSALNNTCQSLDPCSIQQAPPPDDMSVNFLALDLGDVDAWQNSENEIEKRSNLSKFLSKFKRQRNTKVKKIKI